MQSHRYKIHGQQSPEKSKAEWRATYEEWLASEPKKKKKWTNPESDSESERERKWKEPKKACKLCGKSISKSNFHRHMKMRHEETSTRSRRTRVAIKRGKTVPLAAPAVSDKRVVELGADREEEEKRGTKGWWGRRERRGGRDFGKKCR